MLLAGIQANSDWTSTKTFRGDSFEIRSGCRVLIPVALRNPEGKKAPIAESRLAVKQIALTKRDRYRRLRSALWRHANEAKAISGFGLVSELLVGMKIDKIVPFGA